MTRIGTTVAILGTITILGLVPARAQDADTMVVVPDLSATDWQPAPANLPKGMTISKIMGDPSKPGPFVLRLTMPANTVIMPHTHSKAETVTVLSGDIYHAHGRTLDKSMGTPVHADGFVYLPQEHPHSLWTTTVPAVIQVSGSGPFGVDYINPADDPSKKN